MNNQLSRPRVGQISNSMHQSEVFRSVEIPDRTITSRYIVPSANKGVLSPKVIILMCTYFGQRYLSEQLDSFERQTHKNWAVCVSDDGSKDATHAILDAYKQKWPDSRLSVLAGPASGFVANFLSLTCKASADTDYYAYSDQDDIWEPDKLERAVKWLENVSEDIPALYCSRTRLIDENNTEIGLSPLFSKPPSIANALMQNIGGGNTMVFNSAARALLCEAGPDVPVVTHDWWVYMVVTSCGGRVFYDSYPSLRYRQHNDNLIGVGSSWAARLKRIKMLFSGKFFDWNNVHIAALSKISNRMTPEAKKVIKYIIAMRSRNIFMRFVLFFKSGIYRQTVFGNFALMVAVVLNKI